MLASIIEPDPASAPAAQPRSPHALVLGCSGFLLAQVHVATLGVALPLLLAGLAVAAWRGEIDFARRASAVEWAFLLLALVWIVAALCGRDPLRSLSLSPPLAIAGLLCVALGRTRDAALQAAWTLVLVAVTAMAMLVLLGIGPDTRGPQALVDASRAGWLVVPNDIAFAACLWPLWWAQARTRAARVVCIAAFALQLMACVALESRLSLLLAAVALGALAWDATRALPRIVLALTALASAAAVLGLGKGAAALEARLQLWQAAWRVFEQAPVLGIGPHNFVLAYAPAMVDAIDPRLTPWPHNLPLELAVSGGLALLLAALLLVGSALRSTCRRGAASVAIGGSVLLLCLLEASALRVWLWVLAGLWLASANRHAQPGKTTPCTQQPPPIARSAPPS